MIHTTCTPGRQAPWDDNPGHRVTESGEMLFNRRKQAVTLEWLWCALTRVPRLHLRPVLHEVFNGKHSPMLVDTHAPACLW